MTEKQMKGEDEEKKPAKKKLIVVDGFGGDGVGYGGLNFSLVSPTEAGRKQIMSFVTCRDYVHDVVRAHVGKDKPGLRCSYYTYGKTAPVDMTKLRLLLHRGFGKASGTKTAKAPEEFQKRIFSGKAAMNLYEKLGGWPESKITTVNHSTVGKTAWLITGPEQWMRAPWVLSMATLILRISANHGPLSTDSLEDLEANWKKLCSTKTEADIDPYLRTCWKKFRVIAEHYEELFDGSPEDFYIMDGDFVGFHSKGGIVSMCSFNTGVGKVDQKFRKLCEKYNLI